MCQHIEVIRPVVAYRGRDWSLIMGRGRGAMQREGRGGQVKFYPYEKGGGREKF